MWFIAQHCLVNDRCCYFRCSRTSHVLHWQRSSWLICRRYDQLLAHVHSSLPLLSACVVIILSIFFLCFLFFLLTFPFCSSLSSFYPTLCLLFFLPPFPFHRLLSLYSSLLHLPLYHHPHAHPIFSLKAFLHVLALLPILSRSSPPSSSSSFLFLLLLAVALWPIVWFLPFPLTIVSLSYKLLYPMVRRRIP